MSRGDITASLIRINSNTIVKVFVDIKRIEYEASYVVLEQSDTRAYVVPIESGEYILLERD